MTNINVNSKNNTIEMTKKFAAVAARFGTEAYTQLQEVRKDYPTYRVVVRNVKKGEHFKGLTFKFMEDYISKHDEDGSIMETFKEFRAQSEDAKAFGAETMSYGEIKKWFFGTYPEIEAYQKKREALLRAVA